jgi:hypothetical protein
MCVVAASVALGIALGSIPGVLRADQARAKLQLRAQARPKAAGKAPGKTPVPSYLTDLHNVRAKAVAPGTLEVTGTYKTGGAGWQRQTIALHLQVIDSDGKAVVDKELSRREIPAAEGNTQTPISERLQVPAGRYEVRVYTHRPGQKRRLLDGSFEPATNCRVCLFDIDVP